MVAAVAAAISYAPCRRGPAGALAFGLVGLALGTASGSCCRAKLVQELLEAGTGVHMGSNRAQLRCRAKDVTLGRAELLR